MPVDGPAPALTRQDSRLLDRMAAPTVLRGAAIFTGIVLLVLTWTRNVNWDEYFFLSHVLAHLDGRLDRPLQTAFVHAFGWLALVPGHETGQIFVARLVMTALFATTLFSLHRIAREMAGREAADIAVLAFLSSGFVIAHGTSFRADPIAAAGLMGALAIMMTGRMSAWQVMAVALLSAGALLVTIKAVLYLPAYLGAFVWRWHDRRVVLRILLAGLIGTGIAAALYVLHAAGITSAPGNETTASAQHALGTTLLDAGLFPRGRDAMLWALLSVGALVLTVIGLITPGDRRARAVCIGFVLPLILSVLFYRNAFAYFFAYITPPVMVVAAIGAARLGRGPLLGALVALMLATGAGQAIKALSENADLQRATLAEVHRLFPEPVHYIDQNAMVASFPRDVFFMSTWGITRYRSEGQPVMADLIERTAPPLLLTNRWALHRAMTDAEVQDEPMLLMPEDQVTLRATYVHYAGVIWLAGREVTLGTAPQTVDLPIPGRYRLESPAPVTIDGRDLTDGMTLDISGPFVIRGPEGLTLRLVWDTQGAPRENALPPGGLYAGFWQL